MAERYLNISQGHQQLVLSGMVRNSFILSLAINDMNESYFTDSSCRIIFKSLSDYYKSYGRLPVEDELMLAVEANYFDLGDSLNTVKDNLHQFYNREPVDEDFLLDKLTEMIKKVRVSRALGKSLDKLSNGTDVDDESIVKDLISSLEVKYTKSGILCLGDTKGLESAREEAVGKDANEVIKSVLVSVNTSLQSGGYQRGTINLVVSPPGCFVGDTRIITSNGDAKISDLYNDDKKDIDIYGCDKNGRMVDGVAEEACLSYYAYDLIDVSFRYPRVWKIRCTPDHPFMLKDGTYKKAEDLTTDDVLMTTCRKLPIKSVSEVHLKKPVPVYGLVNASPYHNYAIAVGDEGDGLFVSNTGKTSFLVNEGAYAALQGFNTLHVFLGDMFAYDGFIRYLANISGKPQRDISRMTSEEQANLIDEVNREYNNVLSRISVLSYGAGEVTVDAMIEAINKEQDRLGMKFDDIIIDYADNLFKDDTSLYTEGGYIYNRLSLYGRTNRSVIMVASQPKIQYWKEEVIPLEGASESSKKQHVVDLAMTFNLYSRTANIGTFFLPKVRRGISGKMIRVQTEWEKCRLMEITEQDYNTMKSRIEQTSNNDSRALPRG